MASYLTDMDEIRRIIFEASDSSDDSWQSSSEDSIRSSGSDSESENTQTTHGSEREVQASTSGTSRQWLPAPRQRQQSFPLQQDQQTEWRPINERYEVQYPEFTGPEDGPTFDFPLDSDPVIFFDKLFTNELWELLVIETNRYARQNNVNNWQDTTKEEIRCFIGFLFGISINKAAEINYIWSSD